MKIIIVGGGAAGWITSFWLSSIGDGNQYINISSNEIPIIGVGEGTTGRFTHTFSKVIYKTNITQMMYECNALPKLGIKFRNWNKSGKDFWSPLDGTFTQNYYIDYATYINPGSQYSFLMDSGRSNYFTESDRLNCNVEGHGFHLDAFRTAEYFRKRSIMNGVEYIDSIVKKVNTQDNKITTLVLDDGTEVSADLFIDCSGFARVLSSALEDTGWEDYSKYLPVNQALVFSFEEDDETSVRKEYTLSEAMDHGWVWEIPTRYKVGRGYVYCDKFATEDEIIAYSWEKYLTTGDPKWPLNIPMTKSAVTAMDAIQDYCAEIPLFPVTINDFFVSGGSKRGWTTFLTAAVDDRVMAIAPIVFDALNLVNSFRLHYASYGEWSPAVHDYEDMGVFNYFTEPIVQDLMQIVDPFVYRDRLTMPKYMMAATGDEFFVPAAQNYVPDLLGEKHMAYFPNTGHGFSEEEANLLQNLFVFYQAALDNAELPDYSWERLDDGSIEIICETQPSEVNLWQAVNPTARDFRDYVVGDPWTNTALTDQGGGVYIAEAILPDEGWRGMFVELQFDLGYDYPFMVTTEVSIFPDDLPFGVDATLSVIDHSNEYLGFNVSGQLTYYETVPLSDDGVEGDVFPNDDIWAATISAIPDGEYNWHVYGLGADGAYSLISGAENLVVIVSGSNIAGDLEYNIVSVQNGDVNLDGQINIQDVIISVNITLGIYEPSTEQFEMADINNDGIVNVLDIIQLVNIILGN